MIIVPDTNVIISAHISKSGYAAQILEEWEAGTIDFALSQQMLQEYQRALGYDKVQKYLQWSNETINAVVSDLASGAATIVPATSPVNVSRDPHDNMLFACALEADADYIVSGDKQHVLSVGSYRGIQTLSPQDFVTNVLDVKKAA